MLYRISCVVGLVSLLLGATLAFATVEPSERNAKLTEYELDGYGTRVLPPFTFVGKQTATVVWIGNKASHAYLGLYVYDANGNCVACDDLLTSRTREDKNTNAVAVQWVPAETGSYTVELVNLSGFSTEKAEFTAK